MINAVDTAIMTALQSDGTLAALAPGRVHFDFEPEVIPPARSVIITMQSELADVEHGGVAHYRTRYQIKVIDPATSVTAAAAALDRIDALLNHQPLTIAGHTHMLTERVERFAYRERVGTAIWQHTGCDYVVWSDPT